MEVFECWLCRGVLVLYQQGEKAGETFNEDLFKSSFAAVAHGYGISDHSDHDQYKLFYRLVLRKMRGWFRRRHVHQPQKLLPLPPWQKAGHAARTE